VRLSVPLTGCDLDRLARALKVPLRCFVEVATSAEPAPGLFRLGRQGPWWRLLLARTPGTTPACVFLRDFPGGYRRCAVYADRPTYCRAYPSFRSSRGELLPLPGRPCPENALAELGTRVDWGDRLARLEAEQAADRLAVESWNRRLDRLPGAEEATVEHFLAYQLELRRRLARANALVDAVAMGELLAHLEGDGDPEGAR